MNDLATMLAGDPNLKDLTLEDIGTIVAVLPMILALARHAPELIAAWQPVIAAARDALAATQQILASLPQPTR